jgi:hypothetical protein
MNAMDPAETHASDVAHDADGMDDDYEYTLDGAPAEPAPQVSSYIAIIRIIAVLGMGVCMSFGLFLMLIGIRGLIIGIPLFLMAIPCYFGMQWAERLALRAERRSD